MATPALATLPLHTSSSPLFHIVIPSHEHKREKWGAEHSVEHSLSPTHVHLITVRLPSTPSCSFVFKKIGKSTLENESFVWVKH